MRKIILFFTGLLILVLMFGALGGAGAIYDATRRMSIETYFFLPNNLSEQRVGRPVTAAELGPDKMRRRLIEHYISEYFYVIPDVANVEKRMGGKSPLAVMSVPGVFDEWKAGEGAEIQRLAEKGVFRTARLVGDIFKPENSDYWTITYELATWREPNNMQETPVITRDVLYLRIQDAEMMEFRDNIGGMDITQYLDAGYDPAAVFKFGILYIGRGQG